MYCPECAVEYRPGFTECSDCHVALVENLPEASQEQPEPDLELVTVLEGNNPLISSVAKELLEQAGIPYFMEGEDVAAPIVPVDGNLHRWWRLQVANESEAQSRALLDEAISQEDLIIDVDAETQPLVEDQ